MSQPEVENSGRLGSSTPEDREERLEIIASHISGILETLGEEPREGLKDTPMRVARMFMDDIYRGGESLEKVLSSIFVEETSANELIFVRDIPFAST